MADHASREESEHVGPASTDADTGAPGRRISPTALGYLIGPAAFVAILALMHFDVIARVSPWAWLGIFIAIPVSNLVVDHLYGSRPSRVTFHIRVAVQIATVTTVIYLTGWGPVLWGAYAFVALADIAGAGS